MSHWNHRVVRSVMPDGQIRHQIAEVYYNDEGQPFAWCDAGEVDHFSDWEGDPLESLRRQVKMYGKALAEPVMEASQITAEAPWKS